jgi:hypothetical protein
MANFIHVSGFIPTQADLTEKDSKSYPILSLFLRKSSKKVCDFALLTTREIGV